MAKSRLAKWLKIIIPLSLGVFFVWYSIADTTPLERKLIWQNIKNANLFWVLMSILLGLISHIVRANRWKLLLKPLRDTPKLSVCFYTVMFGYLANLGIPRSGEVLRGASYASLSPLSFEQSFGTIITERLIDFIVLLIIIGIALIFQTDQLLNYLNISEVNPLNTLIYLSILIATIVVFYRLIKTTKNRIILKLKDFIYGLLQGIKTVFKLKQKWSFIAQTLIIWLLYIAMFWVIKYAIVGSENISIGAALVGFIAGTFAMSLTSGGIGLYPLAIASVYKLYDVPVDVGQAFGWVLWTAQTLLVILAGSISALLLTFVSKKS
ncbi:lysylphosphatidylglycerol synthase transmembrane domain-containing protein [Psychroflexus sp. MBR-150]|jgi:uncharacterized protein (TIRG00374 family)